MGYLIALRPHQWVKNIFVLAALVFSKEFTQLDSVINAFQMVFSFSLAASSIYLVNDIADYERDRVHPKKRLRPIASGRISRRGAGIFAVFVAPFSWWLAWLLSPACLAVVSVYTLMNLSYSLKLKHVVLLDVFIIAAGFLLRVTAGAFAINVGVSPWLILCTFFVALFLAFCKRRNELESLGENAAAHRGILANYSLVFIDKMVSALASLTIMSYALYTIDPKVVSRLGTDGLILTLPIVLYGIFRYLFLVHQKQLGGSPTEVMLKDRSIQVIGLLYLGLSIASIYFKWQVGLIAI